MTTENQVLQSIADLLAPNHRVLIVTGAGISADSGLPTYRGTGGIYELDDTEDNMPIEEALSGHVFQGRPDITWKYLAQIADSARGKSFNAGHLAIANMEQHFSRVDVLTQNVDGFHKDAGSKNVIEIHGNLRSITCTQCGESLSIDPTTEIEIPPRCDACQAVMRPDVVLFGEMLPIEATQQLAKVWETGFDVVFSIGTTSVFPYIAEPFIWASQNNRPAIEINPDRTEVSHYATHKVKMPAAEALPSIMNYVIQSS